MVTLTKKTKTFNLCFFSVLFPHCAQLCGRYSSRKTQPTNQLLSLSLSRTTILLLVLPTNTTTITTTTSTVTILLLPVVCVFVFWGNTNIINCHTQACRTNARDRGVIHPQPCWWSSCCWYIWLLNFTRDIKKRAISLVFCLACVYPRKQFKTKKQTTIIYTHTHRTNTLYIYIKCKDILKHT